MRSLHIKDSYKIQWTEDIIRELNEYSSNGMLSLKHRNIKSYYREWVAHNWLYNHNLFKLHTKDVDLEYNFNPIMELGYWLLFQLSIYVE